MFDAVTQPCFKCIIVSFEWIWNKFNEYKITKNDFKLLCNQTLFKQSKQR
jgi:hypothetical protein